VTCPLILMVALQKEESTAKSDSAQCRGSSLLLVPLRPNLAVQCQLLEDLLGVQPGPSMSASALARAQRYRQPPTRLSVR
jgi:hypothetical protein